MIKINSNIQENDIYVVCNGAKRVQFSKEKNNSNSELDVIKYPNLTLQVQQFSTYNKFIYNENLLGNKNGINNTFTISSSLIPDTEQIISNGNIIKKPEDYNISGSVVILNFSPGSEEQLTVNYIKQ